MFGIVADTATNRSLGKKFSTEDLPMAAWIVFILLITASIVAPLVLSFNTWI